MSIDTPSDDESGEEPAGDTAQMRERFADRLREVGLSEKRFIPIPSGDKGAQMSDHQQPGNWLSSDSSRLDDGNYGIHPGGFDSDEWWLIEFDVDDYDGSIDRGALGELPETFTVESPHTNPDDPGHRYYAVSVDDVDVIEELAGSLNPDVSWGEIKTSGKYTVGVGSQLDGCKKEWCDECAKPDGGWYRVADDRKIARIDRDDLETVLRAEPGVGGQTASELFGYDGDGDDRDDRDYDGDDLSKEQVESALEHVDENLHYNDWLRVGFALYDWDSSSRGKTAFEEWSSTNAKWDASEGQPHIDDIWDNHSANGNVSVGTLVHHAKQGGWSGPSPSHPGGLTGGDAPADTSLPQPAAFECRSGLYGYPDDDGGFNSLANFQLEARSFLIEDGGATVRTELTVHPASEESSFDITVPMEVFNEPRSFRKEVATGRTTVFNGGMSFLNKLRAFVGSQDAPKRTPTDHIGLHGVDDTPEFVSPSGVLRAGGWADEPNHVFTGGDSFDGKVTLQPPEGDESGEFDNDTVVEILELLPQTRDSDRFLPILAWFYAAPFRPLIMEWEGEFNLLSVTGDTGSGKTATLGTLSECFGLANEPFAATGTDFPKKVALATSNAVPVWFDEFKPADMSARKVSKLKHYLRLSTRGARDQSGNADKTIDEYRLLAPAVISGEQILAGPAEERRSIQTTLRRGATESGSATNRAYAKLAGGGAKGDDGAVTYHDGFALEEHAIAYYHWVLERVGDGGALEREWQRAGEEVARLLANDGINVHETIEQGYQTILFGCRLYRAFCESVGADSDSAGVTDEAASSAITHIAIESGGGVEPESHLDRLLAVAGRAAYAGYLKSDEHYKLIDTQSGGEELRLKLSTAFDEIRRYVRDHDVADGDLLDSSKDYRTRIKDGESDDDDLVAHASKQTRGLNRTCAFSVERAAERIETFERGLFTDAPGPGESTPSQAATEVVGDSEPIRFVELREAIVNEFEIGEEKASQGINTAKNKGTIHESKGGFRKS